MSNESSYHGYRYLVDVKTTRQYAIQYNNGRPSAVYAYSGAEARQDSLVANETIIAYDDDQDVEDRGSEGRFLNTLAYKIDIGSNGKPVGLKSQPVSFKMTAVADTKQPGFAKVTYTMTEESMKELKASGFDTTKMTSSFFHIGKVTSKSFFVPPKHEGGAYVARSFLETPDLGGNDNYDTGRKDSSLDNQKGAIVPRPSNPRKNFNQKVNTSKKYKIPDRTIEAVIKEYCHDYTEDAVNGTLDPIIGRSDEVDKALKVLTRRKQSSLCFTGDAGVGKTAMFSAVAQRLADDETLPESLSNSRVLELDLQAMNAGAKYRGQFEERLKPLIDGLKERGGVLGGRKIILAIDEIHSQLTAGKAEGGTDSGNMMKPFLTAKGISVMGTTTDAEYKKHIEKDSALASRFERFRLEPPDTKHTVQIIKKLWPLTKEHNSIAHDLSDEDFSYIVTMTNRYALQEAQPRKAEKVMNMAAASAEFNSRDQISREDIIAAVSQMSNLPADFLGQSDNERFLNLGKELSNKVLGQPGLQRIVDGLIGSRSGLTDEKQPWGCFVLQGPTGTGKTFTGQVLAEYLFGDPDAMVRLDMSEYSEKHSVSRLIGAPPGYVGFDSAEPALTEQIRKKPYCILFLDEIEKAHPDVFNTLLPILNDGKMTDNQGKTVLFNNVIVMMSSNAGAEKAMSLLSGGDNMGFGGDVVDKDPEDMEKVLSKLYGEAMQQKNGGPFAPEMINRIEELGGFITFLPLDKKGAVATLTVREIDKVNVRLNSQAGANLKNITLVVSDDVKTELSELGYNPAMGARPLRKVVREKIANPFAKWLMSNRPMVEAFIAKNGKSELLIDSLEGFEPKLQAVTPVNDNKEKPKVRRRKRTSTPK